MTRRRTPAEPLACGVIVALLIVAAPVFLASEELPPGSPPTAIVPGPGFAESAAGELLLGELGCVHCHAAGPELARRVLPRSGPHLHDAGSRITPWYLRAFLLEPQATKPGTTMPSLLHDLEPEARNETAEDLVHYLSSLRSPQEVAGVEADAYQLETGKRLYHRVGCVACHEPQEPPEAAGIRTGAAEDPTTRAIRALGEGAFTGAGFPSIPLGPLASRTTAESLAAFLADPLRTRPSGRMPSFGLSAHESLAIAIYLLREQVEAGDGDELRPLRGLRYTYYEGPGFHSVEHLTPDEARSRGSVETVSIEERKRNDHFGFSYAGLLRIATPGTYRFHTTSDDGSRLWIGDRLVVDNDGDHGATHKSGDLHLDRGEHPLRLSYYNHGGPFALNVEYEGPGLSRRELPPDVLAHFGKAMRPLGAEEFAVDPARAARGKELFRTLGCAACHAIGAETKAASTRTARGKPLRELGPRASEGCLAVQVPPGLPRFSLESDARSRMQMALRNLPANPHEALRESEVVRRALAVFNCYACHTRGGLGGPSRRRAEYFGPSIEADMGDEGRFPPALDGVGAKLRKSWLRSVLVSGGSARPYLATRMPRFGEETAGWLADAIVHADLGSEVPDEPPPRMELESEGRLLAGNNGLSCITCHRYGKYESVGIPAADLARMTERLRKPWFRRFLLDPQGTKPGTRMPEFWPDGKPVRPEVLGGDTEAQVEALWAYLSKGESPKIPHGLKRKGMELVPEDEAIVYRHFIQGAGPRGIAVGYPEEAHIAFDANAVNLSMVWRGSFLDASMHRTGRGGGFVTPLGEAVVHLGAGPAFAHLEGPDAPWPRRTGKEAGFRMGGYRLDAQRRPRFFYTFGDLRIEDYPRAMRQGGELFFLREIEVVNPAGGSDPEDLWFRAAAGSRIESSGSWFVLDGRLRLRFDLPEGIAPRVRVRDGSQELVVPIHFSDGRSRFVEVLAW